jgi:hypothetical protein
MSAGEIAGGIGELATISLLVGIFYRQGREIARLDSVENRLRALETRVALWVRPEGRGAL